MADLIGIDPNNGAIASQKGVPGKSARRQLVCGSVVLEAAEGDVAQRVVGDGMELGGTEVAVDRDPGAGRSGIRVHQPNNAAIIRLQQIAIGVEGHESGVGMRRGPIGTVANGEFPGGSGPAKQGTAKRVAAVWADTSIAATNGRGCRIKIRVNLA